MNKEELYEELAAIQHEIWSSWMRYMFSNFVESVGCADCYTEDAIIISDYRPHRGVVERDNITRWKRQINTPYEQLSEREKQSDREQVEKFWHLIKDLQ